MNKTHPDGFPVCLQLLGFKKKMACKALLCEALRIKDILQISFWGPSRPNDQRKIIYVPGRTTIRVTLQFPRQLSVLK